MKKIALIIIGGVLSLGAHAQLLWKISGDSLAKPSYVVGTMHMANASFAEQIPGVKTAINNTDQMYGEVSWDALHNPDTINYVKSTQMLPNNQTIKQILTPVQMKKLNAVSKKYQGTDFNNPKLMEQMGHMTPNALNDAFVLLMYLSENMGRVDPLHPIDSYFMTQAIANHEYFGGLETVKQQADVLKKSTGATQKRAVQLLMCLLNNENFYIANQEDMDRAYYSQDLKALEKAMDEKLNNSCDPTAEENAVLIYNRNAAWLKKIPVLMRQKPTLFVVGAGHLVGEKGLLEGLRKLGYTVEAVKE